MVVVLSLMHLAALARVSLDESKSRAELLANAIYHRAREVVARRRRSRTRRSRRDPGLRSILESSLYSDNVTFAAIVDADGIAVAHADPTLEGQPLPPAAISTRCWRGRRSRSCARSTRDQGRNLEFGQPLLLGDIEFGSIRIGVSTLLIRDELNRVAAAGALTRR